MGNSKAVPTGKSIAVQSYLKEQEKHWLKDLSLSKTAKIKKNKKKTNPKLVEGEKSELK